ncbi:unnamed protein product [Closterium sp. Yama58-4]|nr:unnamed protein product [Closterium sp. Yama58-4]
MTAMYTEENEEKVLSGQPDYVVDCIDNIDTKVALLSACVRRGLPVISAMGAGARADPTRIRIADISESSIDPLSRAVRQRLRKALGAAAAVEAVFSLDRPKAKLLPVADESLQPADLQVVPGFRVRVIPVLGTIPAMFGLALATRVVTSLAGMDVGFEPVLRLSADHYSLLHQRLVEREEMRFGSAQEVEVDMDDVMFVVREVWRGRSAWQLLREKEAAEKLLHSRSGLGGGEESQQAVETEEEGGQKREQEKGENMGEQAEERGVQEQHFGERTLGVEQQEEQREGEEGWNAALPPTIDNLILFTFDEAEAHEAMSMEQVESEHPELFQLVDVTLERARRLYT